jgi:hypothetical protein
MNCKKLIFPIVFLVVGLLAIIFKNLIVKHLVLPNDNPAVGWVDVALYFLTFLGLIIFAIVVRSTFGAAAWAISLLQRLLVIIIVGFLFYRDPDSNDDTMWPVVAGISSMVDAFLLWFHFKNAEEEKTYTKAKLV